MGKKQKRKTQGQEAGRADTSSSPPDASLASAVLVAADRGADVSPEVLSLLGATTAAPSVLTNEVPQVDLDDVDDVDDVDDDVDDDDDDERHAAEMAPALAYRTEPGQDAPASMPPSALRPTLEPGDAPSVDEIEQQIRDLEAKLDLMIGQGRERPDKPAPIPAPPPEPEPKGEARPEAEADDATASEVLPPEFVARKWGRTALRSRSEYVDDFGLDPAFEAKIQPIVDFLQKYYFRVEARGIENVPAEGRCLVVANHAGGPLPYDGAMLRAAIRRKHPAHRELRWLTEDFVYYLPFVGTLMNRLGAVRACQENAERLLGKEALVAVFPEGAKGIGKLYRERYRLQRFGRGGFIRLCLRTRTPIVPCAIIGAEEANPMLYRIEYMTKSLGIPYFPITPTFPALGALGLLPAPTKWKIQFGEPITWSGYGPEAAEDEILVGRLSERVRASIQGMLDRMLAERRSVWLG